MPLEDRLTILLATLQELLHQPLRPMATVLVYHSVPRSCDGLLADSVPLAEFERQMRYLREEGYAPVTIAELAGWLAAGRQFPERCVAVTFDDGYLDTFENALPVLQRWQVPATVFLAAGYIGTGEPLPWLRHVGVGARPMDWQQVRELSAAGLEIGSHTLTHRFLPHLGLNELVLELARSKEVIEGELDAAATSLSLPFSFPLSHRHWPQFEGRLTDALHDLGYRSCCTMERGHLRAGDDPLTLKRIPVGRGDDLPLFRAKLAGCYSWTQPMQHFYQKNFKSYPVTDYGSPDGSEAGHRDDRENS